MRSKSEERKPGKLHLHIQKWKNCTRCPLHEVRQKVVFVRGIVPCDVLFVGEAPGKSEDNRGQPFIGKAGKLLDNIISRAIATLGHPKVRTAFTNLIGCIPIHTDEDGTKGKTTPEHDEIVACSGKLYELVELAKPKLVVRVGSLAREWCGDEYKYNLNIAPTADHVHIVHPAAILRGNPAIKEDEINDQVDTLTNAIEKYILNEEN